MIRAVSGPCITFLSDFGYRDYYVSAVKGVILELCPGATLVDISHDVRPHDVTEAAFTLSAAYSCFPTGTFHLVVVDPGVGSSRRALIARAEAHTFVGPDNGVLSLALEQESIAEIVEIRNSDLFRQPVSPTFHGRDIFGPVVAHLARGLPPSRFGPPGSDWVSLSGNRVEWEGPGSVRGRVIHIDRFGNVLTSIRSAHLCQLPGGGLSRRVEMAGASVEKSCTYYAEGQPGEIFSLIGSSGHLEIAATSASAAELLGVEVGAEVKVIDVLPKSPATAG